MIPAPIYAFVPFFPEDRTNKALPGEFLSESGSGLSWTPSFYGVGMSADYTNDGMLVDTSLGDARFDAFSAASFVIVYSWSDSAGSDNWAGIVYHAHTHDGMGLQRWVGNSSPVFTMRTSTERVEIRNDSAAIDTGEIFCTIVRWISDAEYEMSTYRLPEMTPLQERIETGSGSNVPGGTYTLIPGDNIYIGGSNSSGGTVGLSGLTIYSYMMWNRALTRDQLKAVAANPHEFVRPSVAPVVFAPVASAVPPLFYHHRFHNRAA